MKMLRLLLISGLMLLFFTGSILAWEAPYDFDGDTVEIGGYLAHWGKDWDEGADLEHLRLVEERFNVEIVFVDDQYHHQAAEEDVIAGDVPYDIGFLQTGSFADAGYYQYVYILEDYLTDDLFDRMPDVGMTSREQMPSIKGNIIGIERLVTTAFRPPLIYWNKDIFEENEVKTPYELMAEDEWTYENFLDIAKQLTADTTGDGQIDQFGIATGDMDSDWGDGIFRDQTFIMPAAYGAIPLKFEDGMYWFTGHEDPNFIAALEMRREIFEAGVESGPDDGSPLDEVYYEGKAAMYGYHGATLMGHENADFDFGIAYHPRASHMEEHVYTVRTGNAMYIPVTVDSDRVEKLIELYLALFQMAEPYIDAEEFEEEYINTLFEVYGHILPDRTAAQIFMEVINNVKWDFSAEMMGLRNSGNAMREILSEVVHGDIGAQAAMDEVAPLVQGDLFDIFE